MQRKPGAARDAELGLLVLQRAFKFRRERAGPQSGSAASQSRMRSDMSKVWGGPSVDWAYPVSIIDGCAARDRRWNLSLRGRTEEL